MLKFLNGFYVSFPLKMRKYVVLGLSYPMSYSAYIAVERLKKSTVGGLPNLKRTQKMLWRLMLTNSISRRMETIAWTGEESSE